MAVKIPTHDQLDYPFLIFKQIDRCEEALSSNRYSFVTAVEGLEALVFQLVMHDKKYYDTRNMIRDNFGKDVSDLHGEKETGRTRNKRDQLLFQATLNRFRAIIVLLDKHHLFPRESKSLEA